MRYAAVSLFVCLTIIFVKPPSASAQTNDWTTCAPEGGYCSFTGTKEVRYGANGSYFYKTLSGGTACTNSVFGDPSIGTAKACAVRESGILRLVLANATNESDIRALTDGMQIDVNALGIAASALNIRADAASDVTQVAFYINGVYLSTEIARPFLLFGDLSGDYNLGALVVGHTYTIEAIPSTGSSLTLTFSIIGSTSITGGSTTLPPLSPTSNLSGRIAISSDGNAHDCDDILATAVSIAILAKSGNAGKLRYYGYSDHLWESQSACDQHATDFGTPEAREYQMEVSAEQSAGRFGGFDPNVFYNVVDNPQKAVAALAAEMSQSSATNPLWVIGAGPMQVIGLALQRAKSLQASSLAHVYVISHSAWNNAHAEVHLGSAGYTFSDLGTLGANLIPLIDQNLADLNVAASNYDWLTSSGDPNLAWLMERAYQAGKKMDQTKPVYLDNSNNNLRFDASDSGMIFWLVTGRRDQTVLMSELKAMLLQ
jgi:hypothetical protein